MDLNFLQEAELKHAADFLGRWGYYFSLTVTIDVNRKPVADSIVGSSVASYFIPSGSLLLSPLWCHRHDRGGLPESLKVQANLIAFNLLSMAVIL